MTTYLFRLIILSSFMLHIGCVSQKRVTIPDAPSMHAPEDVRKAYVEKFQAVSELRLVTDKGGNYLKELNLDNGTIIQHPYDLAPAVDEKSETMKQADIFMDRRNALRKKKVLPGIIAGVGAGLTLAGVIGGRESSLDSVGLPILLVGGTWAIFTGMKEMGEAYEAREAAFHTYNNDLYINLGFEPIPDEEEKPVEFGEKNESKELSAEEKIEQGIPLTDAESEALGQKIREAL